MKHKTKFYIGIACLLGIFAFTDLAISKAIYNPESTFGIFFEIMGEVPMTTVGVFSGIALLATYEKKGTMKDWVHHLGFGLLTGFNALMGSFMISTYITMPRYAIGLLALIYVILGVGFVGCISKAYYKELRQVAKVGIILSFLAVFVITIIKMIWGRERFRHMGAPYTSFTPWYLPQSFTTDNEFMSFPSGHSANASVIYIVTLLPLFMPKLKQYSKVLVGISAVWFVSVMISRVIMGAHFASDVTMGMTLSLTMFWLLKAYFIDRKGITYEHTTIHDKENAA